MLIKYKIFFVALNARNGTGKRSLPQLRPQALTPVCGFGRQLGSGYGMESTAMIKRGVSPV